MQVILEMLGVEPQRGGPGRPMQRRRGQSEESWQQDVQERERENEMVEDALARLQAVTSESFIALLRCAWHDDDP